MVPKTGPRATTRAVPKGFFCEQVIHGIVICGRRASAAWSVFGTRIWSSKWDRKLLHGRAKTATVVSIFGHWGLAILCVCGAVPRPPFADPCPPLSPPCTRTRATRGAAKQWGAALAWRARRARGHAPRDREQCRFSALPPVLVPPRGPVLGTALVALSLWNLRAAAPVTSTSAARSA